MGIVNQWIKGKNMGDPEFHHGVKNIVWGLRRIVSLIYQDSKKMKKKYGVTGPQGLVIKTLHASEEELSSAMLSRLLGVTPSNITGIIDRLEEKGLLKRVRRSDDRRKHHLELTEKGREYGGFLPDLIEEKLLVGLATLKPTEMYGIYSALDKIINIVGGADVEIITDPLDHE